MPRSDSTPLKLTDRGGGRIDGAVPDFEHKRLVRLRRGDPPPERELDLHGLRGEEARRALHAELRAALAAGERCLLVIHGRGARSQAGAVLRDALPAWLAEPPHGPRILAFAAADDHGGGATYVLLRRTRHPIGAP